MLKQQRPTFLCRNKFSWIRRRGYKSEKIREIQNIYRFFIKKLNNSQACAIIEAEMEASDERDEILMFIKNSHRGIMKGYTKSN